MRVKDPFEDVDVGARKAILITASAILLIVAYALVFPQHIALVAMIVAFLVIIMLHELGHFSMAKRADMKTTEFFVGFGPRVWSFKRGETEYGIKGIPLGGYCKVIGMTNLEEVAPEDEPRAYRSKTWSQKVTMAAAGPAVHFIIAIVLMAGVLFFAGNFRAQRPTTTFGAVSAGAQAAGLQKGDKLVSVNGTMISEWSQVHALVTGTPENPRHAGDVVHFVVDRDGQEIRRDVTLQSSTTDGQTRLLAGIASEVYLPHPGVLAAIGEAPKQVGDIAWESVKALGTMFSPSGISNYFRILSGDTGQNTDQAQRFVSPVGFGQLANDAVQSGWVNAIGLLIAINIFIGLFNLLPLLPFDGGHIAIATYEKLASMFRGRKVQVDVAKLMPITVAVVAVLGFIFISSLFLDITRPVANPF